jgi:hypothetical protein
MAVRLARQGRNVAIVTMDNQANRGLCTPISLVGVCRLDDEAFAVSPDHPAVCAHHALPK